MWDEQKAGENPIATWLPQGFSDFGKSGGIAAQGSQGGQKKEKVLISEVLGIGVREDEPKSLRLITRKG